MALALPRGVASVLLLISLASSSHAQERSALEAVDRAVAMAEVSLRSEEFEEAESHYRTALFEGWMLLGALHAADHRLDQARQAFESASRSAVEARAAFQALALVHLQAGQPDDAVAILTRLAGHFPRDLQTRRLLAQALTANGQAAEAVQELEEAYAAAPDDAETAFLLASGYLRLKKIEAAERLFTQVAAARPIPQTWVLIGRMYRDQRLYDRARAALLKALELDPKTRRAHYYLGTVTSMEDGVPGLEGAIREFQAELAIAPDDAPTRLRLGMAFVEARREAEALPLLESLARAAPSTMALLYLGRSLLALDRPGEAVTALREALSLADAGDGAEASVRNLHYQLGLALRQLGDTAAAARHFDAAKEASARHAEVERLQLDRYLTDVPDPVTAGSFALDSPLAALPPDDRVALERRAVDALARAYLNLGIMRVQRQQFVRAVEFLELAAAIAPDFPQVQYTLGVARFNAQQYDQAAPALARALEADPQDAELRRMLALAHFNSGAHEQAVRLLAADPGRDADPSLQYVYGLALVRSDRAAEAEAVFTSLLAAHGDRAELHVILGQAHAQQGDFAAAERALARARDLDPAVADAHATLGLIYLKQGKLTEAAVALRAELNANPDNLSARHTLATVLELDGHSEEALSLLRGVLRTQPEFGDARYLLGKILLGQGQPSEALPHLEAAVRLSPDNATYHYQLAQAYLKSGRRDLADRHLQVFRDLKDKTRGRTP